MLEALLAVMVDIAVEWVVHKSLAVVQHTAVLLLVVVLGYLIFLPTN